MKPFDDYPDDRVSPLRLRDGSNTRRIDAPRLQQATGQTFCAYCGTDLFVDFERWLLTSIDHVVPTAEARRLGVPEQFCESMSNLVLCCFGCNGFDNRFAAPLEIPRTTWLFPEFCDLRDRIFVERRQRIAGRRRNELEFFERQRALARSDEARRRSDVGPRVGVGSETTGRLGDPTEQLRRREMLTQPHIEPLASFVRLLRDTTGPEYKTPDLDPCDGGINARVLFVLEAPGPSAIESGFVSRDNDDGTASNWLRSQREAMLPRELTANWNLVPWFIGDGNGIRPLNAEDAAHGLPWLLRFLPLLPRVEVLVLVGRNAQQVRDRLSLVLPARVRIENCPHPSPQFVNRDRDANWKALVGALRRVGAIVSGHCG